MSLPPLLQAFKSMRPAKALVLGDMILDRYTYGNAQRISQESPVIVLHADDQELRLGGAANVCNMLKGLDCHVVAAGVHGRDESGLQMIELAQKSGIDTSLIACDASRPTTLKERFVGKAGSRHPSQILRVDHEKTAPIADWLVEKIYAGIENQIEDFDVILISDYAKGVCTPKLLQQVIQLANEHNIPTLVDPMRGHDYERYRGATLLKANRIETEMATGVPLNCVADASAAGSQLCAQLDLQDVIVTLDRDGMALVHRDGTSTHFPTQARSVYDITGAGDMVLAMLGACLGSGLNKQDSVRLANVAAGLEVEKSGVAVIPLAEIEAELRTDLLPGQKKIVSHAQIASLAEEHRRRGEKLVFTNGCFDLLHFGHVTNLTEASKMGDVLVVGLNSDESVSKLKGPTRPIISETERSAMLAALSCVDYVVVFGEDTPYELIKAVRPDVLVKGGHYIPEEIPGFDILQQYGGEVRLVDIVGGFSTTDIIQKVAANETIRRTAA